jgi:O-antigen/teichoic acid export membrane protein
MQLGVVALFAFASNIILIPFFGFIGSAWANFLSYMLLFVLGISVVGSITKYDKKFLVVSFLKILLACVVMYLAVTIIKTQANFMAAIIAGMAVYFVASYGLGLFSIGAVKGLLKDFRKK